MIDLSDLGHTEGADQSSKGRGSFRQGGHKPAFEEFRRWSVGESTDETPTISGTEKDLTIP